METVGLCVIRANSSENVENMFKKLFSQQNTIECHQKQRIMRKTMAIIKKNNNVAFWWLSLAFGSKSVKVKRFVRKY